MFSQNKKTFCKKRYMQLLRDEIFLISLAEVIEASGDIVGAKQVWSRVWKTREARKSLCGRMPV